MAHYDINTQYLGITQDKTMAMEISPQQFRICQEANGHSYTIPTACQPAVFHYSFLCQEYS